MPDSLIVTYRRGGGGFWDKILRGSSLQRMVGGPALGGGGPVWVLGWVEHMGQGALEPPLCVKPASARG